MPLSTAARYQRVKEATKTDETQYDLMQQQEFANAITEFTYFVKRIDPLFRQVKGSLARYLTSKQHCIVSYQEFAKMTNNYEDLNLSHYTDMKSTELIFNAPENQAIRDTMLQTASNLRNPYIDLYHWVKGELYDIQALLNAVNTRKEIESSVRKLEDKKTSTQKDLENVTAGKTTVTTLFKSSADQGNMANKIERTENEITATKQLLDLLTVYLGETVIKTYKAEKLNLYKRILQQFTVIEISNAHSIASFWSQVIQNDKVKASC